jgi:hypothetical protein
MLTFVVADGKTRFAAPFKENVPPRPPAPINQKLHADSLHSQVSFV